MATTHQDTNVNQLVINKLTKQEFNNLSQVSSTELYLVEESLDSAVTQNSTNPVQSGAVYDAIQDIGGNINDGTTTFTKNNQTIGTTSANQENDKTIAIPNDVEMVYFAHSKALSVQTTDAYYDTNYNYLVEEDPATWTDPNPQHRITTDGYYYDLSTGNIYQVNNYETIEVTSNVTIQGDTNKLYCDVDDNKLYRYDGSNFVVLTSNFSGDYNDLINKPDLNFLKQRDLTTYQGENDEIVQHVGNNSSGYANGYVYKKSNVHSLTYNGVTYNYVGETDDNVTWKLYKITQDNIDYVVPQGVTIGDNFWVVRDFTDLEVVHIFEIDNISDNVEGTQMDIEGHFLGTNITLHFVAPYSEIINTSKALIYKNGNNYLYCDSTFKFFASSVNNNNANVIPFDGTVNDAYIWERTNVQPQQLSLESNKVKYTLSNGTTKLTLAQENDLKTVAFSGSYNDLTDKLQNATTSAAGLMSANDKSQIQNITKNYYNAYSNVAVNVIINDIIRTRENGYYTETGSAVFNSNCSELPSKTVTLVEWFRGGNMGYKTFLKAFTNDDKFWVGYFMSGTTPTSITWKQVVTIS